MLDDLYGNATISNTTIDGHNESKAGGGAYFEDIYGDLSITGSTITGNEANTYWGGGLYASSVSGATTHLDVDDLEQHRGRVRRRGLARQHGQSGLGDRARLHHLRQHVR